MSTPILSSPSAPDQSDGPDFDDEFNADAIAAVFADSEPASHDDQVSTPGEERKSADTLIEDLVDFFQSRSQAPATQNFIVAHTTREYLARLTREERPAPSVVEQRLLAATNAVIRSENLKLGKEREGRTQPLKHLTPWQGAQAMLALHHVVRISFGHGKKKLGALALYATSGPAKGTYVVDEDDLRRLARRYNTAMTLNDFKEVMAVLKEDAAQVSPCEDRDLIGVKNGIFDYRTKQLLPFSPDVILMAKVGVDYVDAPGNPVIRREDGTAWDVESWMSSLTDDPELVDLGWRALGAMVRPNVSWSKGLMLYNEEGNNGKGTYMSLGRSLVGPDSWGALSIADFEDKFRLPEIVGKTAFGTDENDVGAFTDKMANFKATITNDAVMIERKHQDPYWYQPRGLMVQCLNDMPKSKDTSQSYYRRLLFWKFDKSFEGREDKAIKDDFLKRREVLEYVLFKVLNLPDYYDLPEPASSKAVLADFKETNDPVREFWCEIEERLVWDLQPQEFLHDLFIRWCERVNPRGGGLKRREFYNRIKRIVAEDGRWEDGQWGTSTWMDDPEPLIAEYDLTRWMNPAYAGPAPVNRQGSSLLRKCQPVTRPKYRGLRRAGCMEAKAAQLQAQNDDLRRSTTDTDDAA